MSRVFSIRNSLQGELLDFLKSSGFESVRTTELVRDLTCLLASYREEDVLLYPVVFLLPSAGSVAFLAPGTQRIKVGEIRLNDGAESILKKCATLARGGWGIYVVDSGKEVGEYGVFRASTHSFAVNAEESMHEEIAEKSQIVLIRNRGRLVVELRNSKGESFTASFNSATASEPTFAKHVLIFANAACADINDEIKTDYIQYFRRLFTNVLQHCHGTLLAAYSSKISEVPESIKDCVWLDPRVDLASTHRAAVEAKNAESLATLQAYEELLRGMIASDGVVVFGTDGSILAYRAFLKPTESEKKDLVEKGGGRRRTYALMQQRLGQELKAAFFRSQDGETDSQATQEQQ
jgi:hypothetical protein